MPQPESTEIGGEPSTRWIIAWLFVFLFSLLPPLAYHWMNVPGTVEPQRGLGGLLPAPVLGLREFGKMSHWVPVALVGSLLLSLRKPNHRRTLICLSATGTAIFASFYAAYCLVTAAAYIELQNENDRQRAQAEQGAAPDA